MQACTQRANGWRKLVLGLLPTMSMQAHVSSVCLLRRLLSPRYDWHAVQAKLKLYTDRIGQAVQSLISAVTAALALIFAALPIGDAEQGGLCL
jgi:hypothetical protein